MPGRPPVTATQEQIERRAHRASRRAVDAAHAAFEEEFRCWRIEGPSPYHLNYADRGRQVVQLRRLASLSGPIGPEMLRSDDIEHQQLHHCSIQEAKDLILHFSIEKAAHAAVGAMR